MHIDRTRNRLGTWLDQLSQRAHFNKVTVALANKMARMARAVITRPGGLYQRLSSLASLLFFTAFAKPVGR